MQENRKPRFLCCLVVASDVQLINFGFFVSLSTKSILNHKIATEDGLKERTFFNGNVSVSPE